MKSVIFTPDSEPYLGLPELQAFDELIVSTMSEVKRASTYTFSEKLNTHQQAATLLIPSGISLCLSVRELIRQAYLHGALTLLRPILERAVTITYLRTYPEALTIWDQGWSYRERPKLREMTTKLYSGQIGDETTQLMEEHGWTLHQVLTSEGNEIVHGGPAGLLKNINQTEKGAITTAGRVVNRPDLAKQAALECATWLAVLMSESAAAFPETEHQNDPKS